MNAPARSLIVNADDFGRSPGINRGIVEAHERGIVTSASLMVLHPGAAEAGDYARRRPELGVGLHFDLGEWAYRGGWVPVYERAKLADVDAVKTQLSLQLAEFRRLTGGDPTHLDSHHHVHREEPVRALVAALAAELDLPARELAPEIRYSGDFYGQGDRAEPYPDGIGVETLLATLHGLPAGTTELGCHPGYADDIETTYGAEREVEVRTLCDPQVRAAIDDEGIELRTFRDPR